MNRATIVVLAVLAVAFGGFATFSIIQTQKSAVDFSVYDYNSVIEGNKDNGGIGDHVRGNAKAPVMLFEYADVQCPGCAVMHPRLEKILAEYGDKVGIVYRSIILSYHQNSTAATMAAEAAGKQGYWNEYTMMLFKNQSAWQEIAANQRESVFTDFFKKVTEEKGDVEKFRRDMMSKEVKRKIDFDAGIAERMKVPGTPALYLDGKKLDLTSAKGEEGFLQMMRDKINEKLGDKGEKK